MTSLPVTKARSKLYQLLDEAADSHEPIQITGKRSAQKDASKLASANLQPQAQRLLEIIAKNPFQNPPPHEKLI